MADSDRIALDTRNGHTVLSHGGTTVLLSNLVSIADGADPHTVFNGHGSNGDQPDDGCGGDCRDAPVDYSPTSGPVGSTEKIYDVRAPRQSDGRSEMRTMFYLIEAPDRQRWEQLQEYQEEHQQLDGTARREVGRERDALTWLSQLGCTDRQRDRVCHLLEYVDGDDFGTVTDEAVVLALLSLVYNEDGRRVRSEDTWDTITEACGVDPTTIRQCRTKLHPLL